MGRLSFSIAINLLTDNFKNGTSRVKAGFQQMQMQMLSFAAALGAGGVGLSSFITRMVETARETNRVNTALKNISGTAVEFANNQAYLIRLAKKYGLEINVLTGNFAKFSASANSAGMAMSDQRAIFDSVSRAITAFGLSSEDANLTFLAISQMISKGKISSEELRRQLGERLPIAMAAMAKAAGVSIAQLDKLMKDGKLYSSEVLPKFAKALNEMIPNVSTDNLETSINRLKNAFTEFVNNSGIQGFYKSFIDKITALLKNTSSLFVAAIAVTSFAVSNFLVSLYRDSKSVWDGILANATKKERLSLDATNARVEAQKRLEEAKAAHAAATGRQEVVAQKNVEKAKIALSQTTAQEKKSMEAAQLARSKASVGAMKTMFISLGRSIKAVFATFWPAALIGAISSVVAKMISMKQEANEVKKIFSSYRSEAAKIGLPEEAAKLQLMQKIANDTTNSYKVRSGAIKEINSLLGTNYSIDSNTLKINGDINSKISERVALLKSAAAVEFYQSKKLQADDEIKGIYAKYGGQKGLENRARLWLKKDKPYRTMIEAMAGGPSDYQDYLKVLQLQNISKDADKQMSFFEKNLLEKGGIKTVIDESGSDKKSDIQKAEEEYAQSKKELANQLDNQVIKEEEYNKAIDDLNEATYKKIGGLLSTESASKNRTFLEAKEGVSNPLQPKEYRVMNEYYKELGKLTDQYGESLINEDEYNSAQLSLTSKTIENLIALENQTEASKQYADQLKAQRSELAKNGEVIKKMRERTNRESRDTTFDYNLKGSDKIDAQISFEQGKLDSLISAYNNGASDLVAAIDEQLNRVTSLEEALKIAKVKEDVKDLGKSLRTGIYSGVKDIASSANNLVSSWQQLTDTINDVDASGWEKFMAIWAALTNTVDSILTVIETISALTKVSEQLGKAKEAEMLIDDQSTNKAITNAGVKIAAEAAASTASTVSASTEVAANTAVAASGAAASTASIPFGWLAIPGVIAGVIGMMAAIPKFENGGIVGGNSTSGDKILARLNSGEMVLNKAQQAGLYNLVNNGNAASAGRLYGDIIVRGSDIHLALSNYNRSKLKR